MQGPLETVPMLVESTMGMAENHISQAEPHIRPIVERLRAQILNLDRRVKEGATAQKRLTYEVERIFAEVKVWKKYVLVRFYDCRVPDPQQMVRHIDHAKKNGWKHDKEMRLYDLAAIDYLMPFVKASLKRYG
jgi:predicted transport protein